MTRLALFPGESKLLTRVLFINFGNTEEMYVMPLLTRMREVGIPAEIYPEPDKMKKQLNYAHRKEIPYVVLAGENEILLQKVTLKNMEAGTQGMVNAEELIKILSA